MSASYEARGEVTLMKQKVVHIAMFSLLLLLVGCGNDPVDNSELEEEPMSFFYEDPESDVRILEANEWLIEKETATSVKLKSKNLVAIVSVIPTEKSTSEIKQELKAGAGKITVIGEGSNFISWNTDRKESIRTNIYIDQVGDQTLIITLMTPNDEYELNKEKMEAFRENVELYTKEGERQ